MCAMARSVPLFRCCPQPTPGAAMATTINAAGRNLLDTRRLCFMLHLLLGHDVSLKTTVGLAATGMPVAAPEAVQEGLRRSYRVHGNREVSSTAPASCCDFEHTRPAAAGGMGSRQNA